MPTHSDDANRRGLVIGGWDDALRARSVINRYIYANRRAMKKLWHAAVSKWSRALSQFCIIYFKYK